MKFVYLNEAKRIKDLEEQIEGLRFKLSKAMYEQIRAYNRFIKNEIEIESLNGIIKGLRGQNAYIYHKYKINHIDVMECERFLEEYDYKLDFSNKKYEDLTEEEMQNPIMRFSVVLTKKEELEKKPVKA